MKVKAATGYRLEAVVTRAGKQQFATVAHLDVGNGLITGELGAPLEPCVLILVPEYADSTSNARAPGKLSDFRTKERTDVV